MKQKFTQVYAKMYFFMAPQSTAGSIKTVPSVYTLLMKTIYLPHSTHVTDGTFFRKQTVAVLYFFIYIGSLHPQPDVLFLYI